MLFFIKRCGDIMENSPIWWGERGCYGYKKLSKWLREAYIRAVNGRCQTCHQKKKLEINRIIRGCKGGLYTVASLRSKSNNITVDCMRCHKLKHFNEIGMRRK